MRCGLLGSDETARAMAGRHPADDACATLPAHRFPEVPLAVATESHYAHPLARVEIGCVRSADARGRQRTAVGMREPEPVGGPR